MSDWDSFLALHNASLNPGKGYSSQANYIVPLTQQTLLAINGPDAAKFLQGQVTCDVRELEKQQARLGAQCNIKGRMLLTFLAIQLHAEQIILRIHKGLMPQALSNFGKYIVFSKAKLADISSEYCCIGLTGPQAGAIIDSVFGIQLTDNYHQTQDSNGNILIRIDEQRYECWVQVTHADSILSQLTKHAEITSENLWALKEIQSGIGGISPETYELFTPQAINWQLVNGINFRKGCYTGQEIVARLHYRGTLKRHMYRFGFNAGNELPAPASELFNADGKVIGEIILSAYNGSTHGELLASVTDNERDAIYLANNTQKLELLALPYAIPTADEADSQP